jgi:bifunctional non-homologous end joining protein LigD
VPPCGNAPTAQAWIRWKMASDNWTELRSFAPRSPTPKDAPLPTFILPCLPSLAKTVPNGARWLHEIKHDGYRLQARLDRGTVSLRTRNGFDWTSRFPGIAHAVAYLAAKTALLDGEAVVLDPDGVSDFSALQDALSLRRPAAAAILHTFDLLYLNGEDLHDLPLIERRANSRD